MRDKGTQAIELGHTAVESRVLGQQLFLVISDMRIEPVNRRIVLINRFLKRRAVGALQSMPDGEGIPLLIQLAKATRDNDVRKQAMSSLGQSRDGRAISFFEEVLKK